MTTLLLLIVAVGVVLVGARLPRHATTMEHRRQTVRALRRLHVVLDQCRAAPTPDAEVAVVARALRELLGQRRCWYEAAPRAELPELRPDGSITALVQHRDARGIVMPGALAIPTGMGGRFVLLGRSPAGTTLEERIVAGAMAAAPRLGVRQELPTERR